MKQRLKAWGDTEIIPIASVVVLDESGRLLLLQRHSEDLGGGKWGTPGGRIDDGEDSHTAAIRELREETGITVHKATLLGTHTVKMPHGTVSMTTYMTRVPNGTSIVVDYEEHDAHNWFEIENLLQEHNLLWGLPTTLRDFGLLDNQEDDFTLADGTEVRLIELADR